MIIHELAFVIPTLLLLGEKLLGTGHAFDRADRPSISQGFVNHDRRRSSGGSAERRKPASSPSSGRRRLE
jgi:hypothetical protein